MSKHDNNCNHKHSSCISWIKGALFGAIGASIIALLFAPKAGKQMRRKFNGFYHSTTKTSKDFFKYSQKQAKSFMEHTNNLARSISKEIKDLAQSILDNKED